MSAPLTFKPRAKTQLGIDTQFQAPAAGDWFSVTVVLGPFVVGGPAPVWAEVAAMVVAEARREWEKQNSGPAPAGVAG